MNENNGFIINCPKCGSQMNSNARYCMKCGYLNYNHEDNKNMRPYIEKNETTYGVNQGFRFVSANHDKEQVMIGNNIGNKRLCFIITFGIYIVTLLLTFTLSIKGKSLDVYTLMESFFPLIGIISSLLFLYLYSMESIFMKCNKRWWASLIPIYNILILSEIAFNKKNLGWIVVIPVINLIYLFILWYKLGTLFDKSGLLIALFSPIYIPILGLGTSQYKKTTYLETNDQKETERDYKYRKISITCILVIVIISVALIVWKNIENIEGNTDKLGNYYYVIASRKIINKIDKKIKNNEVTCNVLEDGTYYFEFIDLSKEVFLLTGMMRDAVSAEVKVVVINQTAEYYISMTDGTYGFEETKAEEVTIDTVKEYSTKYDRNRNSLTCSFQE